MENFYKAEELRLALSNYFNITLRSVFISIKENVWILYEPKINSFIIYIHKNDIEFYSYLFNKYSNILINAISHSIIKKYPMFIIDIDFNINYEIIVRYDTSKLSELDIGIYAKIFSYLDETQIKDIKTISKQFQNWLGLSQMGSSLAYMAR